MNRILLDELEYKVVNDTYIFDIKSDINLIMNSSLYKCEFNIYDSKVNIFMIAENNDMFDVKFNVYSSFVTLNLVTNKIKDNFVCAYLYDKDSKFIMYNSVIAKEKIKTKIRIFHKACNTESYVYNCGVTKETGSITFDVVSKVGKKYGGCTLNQDSKIISLNSTNENIINPVLLIDNYDTKGSHSAFIGKFNENEVFYFQSKGIKKSDVYKLLLDGFLIGIMDIEDSLKEMLKEKFNKDWR